MRDGPPLTFLEKCKDLSCCSVTWLMGLNWRCLETLWDPVFGQCGIGLSVKARGQTLDSILTLDKLLKILDFTSVKERQDNVFPCINGEKYT